MKCPACGADNPKGTVPCPACGSHNTMVVRDPDLPEFAEDPDTFRYDRPTSKQASSLKRIVGEIPDDTGTGTATSAAAGLPNEDVTGRSGSRIGTLIAKRYELLQLLGKGGMGLVYRAKDHELDEEVAIKLLQPEYTSELSEIERLKREIVTARRITHPNVIRIHEFGMDEGGEAFISMEVLPGGSLEEEMRQGPLPLNRAINIAIGICEGLGSAHEQGIIHRDLKPENVLFAADGRAKLVDFGLARAAGSTQHTVWGVTGTPRYMSPEQTLGGEATPRTDVYSMGVLLFQMFTGQFPFDGRNIEELAEKHATQAPPKPRDLRKEIPARLEAIILRALEKDPAKRWRNANEMALELRALKESSNPSAPRPETAGTLVNATPNGGPRERSNPAARKEPAAGFDRPSQDATLLIRAEVVDSATGEPTSSAVRLDARREPSNPGARIPGDPRREPSHTRAPAGEPRREPSFGRVVPGSEPRREPSLSGRGTLPPLRTDLPTGPNSPAPSRTFSGLHVLIIALSAIAAIGGFYVSTVVFNR